MKRALFPGSFDPFTIGHFDIVLRSLKLVDEVIVAIGHNTAKSRYFPLDLLIPKIEEAFKDTPQVRVMTYQGLTADFAKKMEANILIRGLRNTTDFEYEKGISEGNRFLWSELETVFILTSPTLSTISSTIIRDIHKYGKDVNSFLPYRL
ncbi:MAG TPA: pantetheine-phosphate adenylyltransferase [Cytophagaceae bacterium]|jgi:pantetheine-phosphate adenylyltransferase